MERKQTLIELRDKVAAGGALIQPRPFQDAFNNWHHRNCAGEAFSSYHDSDLNAAMDLHSVVLPGFDWVLTNEGTHAGEPRGPFAGVGKDPDGEDLLFTASGDTPARAWLLAIIDALIAQEGSQ